MNGFLVMLRHTMDDFPLFLSDTFAGAKKFAERAKWDAIPDWAIEGSSPISIEILEFRNGKYVGAPECVRRYEDEPEVADA